VVFVQAMQLRVAQLEEAEKRRQDSSMPRRMKERKERIKALKEKLTEKEALKVRGAGWSTPRQSGCV
jgi:hypothetical protein